MYPSHFFKRIQHILPLMVTITMLFFADDIIFAKNSIGPSPAHLSDFLRNQSLIPEITAYQGSLNTYISLTVDVPVEDTINVIASATPDSICAGASSQLQATVIGGTAPFTYLWTPATGLSNPDIANPVASPTVTTRYHVSVSDAGSNTGNDSVLVCIIPTPPAPGTIFGPVIACPDSVSVYFILPVNGATSYSWMVPSGATIVGGQNTTSLLVQWGISGGNVSVIAGNYCGNSNPSVLPVTMTGPPAIPASILGPTLVCHDAVVIFSVDSVPDASSYFWTAPPDAMILSGQNTDSVSVRWGYNPGDISVIARNNCGQSDPKILSVGLETLPEPAGSINGNDTVCSNYETYTYMVPVIDGATSYIWMIPTGMNITAGSGTNSILITIQPDAVSGNIGVTGKNTCGNGTASEKPITVKICAGIPEIAIQKGIVVYPNPAKDVLNIIMKEIEAQVNLHLINTAGQTILRILLENSLAGTIHKIDVSGFTRGVYFVKLVNDQRCQIQKLVLQ